jgi:hypothetical protein
VHEAPAVVFEVAAAVACPEEDPDGVGVLEPDGLGLLLGAGVGDVAQADVAASRAVFTAAWLLVALACAAVTALSSDVRSPELRPAPLGGVKAINVAVLVDPDMTALLVAVAVFDESPSSSLCNVA